MLNTPNFLDNIKSKMTNPAVIDVRLPQLNVDSQVSDLIPILQNLGFPDASLDHVAPNLSMDNMVHKVIIQQKENGSNNASATVVTSEARDNPEFVANRPFIYSIHYEDLILVQGAIKDNKDLHES
jgi:serine protease inhibitor